MTNKQPNNKPKIGGTVGKFHFQLTPEFIKIGEYATPKYFHEQIIKATQQYKPMQYDSGIMILQGIYYKNLTIAEIGEDESIPFSENRNLLDVVANKDLLTVAFNKISKNKGAMTLGTKEQTADRFSMDDIESLSYAIKTKTFKWSPSRRIWIPKPGKSKLIPLNLNDFHNKIVQESIRMVLSAIYELFFKKLNANSGFRPNKSPHNSIEKLQKNLSGRTFAIEGDIKGAYDNVDHDLLIKILKKKVKDKG